MANYSSQIQKSRRTDARSAVLDLAGREEKLFSTTNAYTDQAGQLGYAAWGSPIGGGYYSVSVAIGNPPITYTVTAPPIAGGLQASDAECTTLSVDQTGNQT